MKTQMAILVLASAALATTATTPALAKRACIAQRDIVSTHSDDGKILMIKLRDGRTLVNHLQGTCSDLRFAGFAWNVHGDGQICESEQTISVLTSGQTCLLGKFDESKPAPKPAP